MVTTRSMSGTNNKTKATRAKSSAKCGTKTVDPNLQEMTRSSVSRKNKNTKATRAKSSANYGTTQKVDPKMKQEGRWGKCTGKYTTKIMYKALCQFMEKDYLKKYFEKHPPPPKFLPYEIDFAGQDEWLSMSDEAKRPWIELAEKMEA
ncbi:hypothetical protein POM88_022956 [Heracleum sosnowskyi]|uniref:Uncharacterized protein n=1 Tax=Heracleum sosnowskyi TaxID=360622 RepID=A0AAD8IGR3_9APIA|nr:hypothetical protein POM88_022956 [Heracleum sosnowskyi]